MTDNPAPDTQIRLLKIIEIIYWGAILGIPLLTWLLPLNRVERLGILALAGISAIFALIMFHGMTARYATHGWINYLIVGATIAIIGVLSFTLQVFNIHVEILYLALIASLGTLGGRKPAYYAVLATVLVEILVAGLNLRSGQYPWTMLGVQALVLGMAAFLTAEITSLVHQNLEETNRQNRHLFMLMQVGQIAATAFSTDGDEDSQTRLSRIAELITHNVPVTACRISLVDEFKDSLMVYGTYPIRPLNGWEVGIGRSYTLDSLPKIRRAIRDGLIEIMEQDEITALLQDQSGSGFFYYGVKSMAIVPLVTQGEVLGVLVAGESRHPEREPFNQAKISVLTTLAGQIAAAVKNTQLLQQTQRQAQRLQVLNEVGRAIGSTIELSQLLELVYQQLSAIIPTDTYYVGLVDSANNVIDMHILYDDGVSFPDTPVPMGQGLSNWVICSGQSLLIHHLSAEWDILPARPIQVGKDRLSESWLGVPIVSGAQSLGLLGVASYRPGAFGEQDVNLLENIAAQAALAIENARQHEAVKEQARRDSLTEAYNHGYFLHLLNEAVEQSREAGAAVSLIMLDIDLFKKYNDQYGHAVGDQVLCALVQAIQAHVGEKEVHTEQFGDSGLVKISGFVGRWGGEEFGIGLPGASLAQAAQVAQLIRQTLKEIKLADRDGQVVPAPTVSQGIAVFPLQADAATELVDVADEALYRAKAAGRDQVVLADWTERMA